MTEKIIQTWQRKRMYGLARELGMTTHSKDKDDELHLLVEGITGSGSLSALTFASANKVIGELEHRQRFGPIPPPGQEQPTEKLGGVSIGQQKKIIALMCELRKYDAIPSTATIEQRVAGIIHRELKMTAVAKDPYSWLTYKDGRKLIEIIKGYLATAARKSDVRSETG